MPLERDIIQKSRDLLDDLREFLRDVGLPPIVANAIAAFFAAIPAIIGGVIGIVVGAFAGVFAKVGAAVLDVLSRTRREAAPELNTLLASTLSELFGVEITEQDIPPGGSPAENVIRAQVIGKKILTLLEGEFAPAGELNPEQGQNAARAFTGFTTQFTVTSAFIAILGELFTAGQLESFRELGVELASNLGLGRLSRRGLSELVSTTVATPYEWFMNKKYRPTLLGPGQAVKAFLRGQVAPEDLVEELSRQGYSIERINSLIAENQASLSVDDLDVLVRYGKWTTAQAVDHLRSTGLPLELAEAKFAAVDLKRVDAHVREHVSLLRTQRENGVLDPIQFASSLQELPITNDEIHTIRGVTEAKLELPRKFLTLTQMRDAFIEGVVDLEELNDFLVREGYSRDDQTILRISILLRLADQTKAEQEREERRKRVEAKRKALSPKPPPSP